MRQNLIDLIKSEKELSSAIILTHNIDFVFLQLVVIPALKAANHPKLTYWSMPHVQPIHLNPRRK